MFKFRRKTVPKCVISRVVRTSTGVLYTELNEWFMYCPKKCWAWTRNRNKAQVFECAERAETLVQWTDMPSRYDYVIKSI